MPTLLHFYTPKDWENLCRQLKAACFVFNTNRNILDNAKTALAQAHYRACAKTRAHVKTAVKDAAKAEVEAKTKALAFAEHLARSANVFIVSAFIQMLNFSFMFPYLTHNNEFAEFESKTLYFCGLQYAKEAAAYFARTS